jgi:hypothetical protein
MDMNALVCARTHTHTHTYINIRTIMEAARTSETSVDNYIYTAVIPEDKSELQTLY